MLEIVTGGELFAKVVVGLYPIVTFKKIYRI